MKPRKNVVHKLLLDTKGIIPFQSAQLTIYQPSVKELGLMNESNFFIAINALVKDYVSLYDIKDNSDLDKLTNFDILMSMIKEKNEQSKIILSSILRLFDLIFPNYNINITPNSFLLQEYNSSEQQERKIHIIDKNNFDEFTEILYEMFGVIAFQGEVREYNPAGPRARALVEKFQKKRELLAKLRQEKGEDTSMTSVFGRYLNILAVGENKDKNILAQYSVYQLLEEFNRFELKQAFDYTLQAKMAGAKNVKDVKDWTSESAFNNRKLEE